MEVSAKLIARWVALGALFLIPFAPLVVADSYFFPFITGKAFYLRVIIEIAVTAWVALAFLDKDYRPRFSWIGATVVAFVLWMFVADLFAINVAKAFWSNFERMEGWVLLAHLLGLFFAASSVLRVEKKWRAWFLTSLGVSFVISLYALLQLAGAFAIHQGSTRIDATLGNSAYLAVYFLFSVFVALWLAFTPRNESKQAEKMLWLKWSLVVLAVLEAVLIFFTETRGAILGLVGALALTALLTAFTAEKNTRRLAAAALTLLLILAGSFYLARNTSFVQNNHTLQRIASISLADGETRFTIWHMAFQGVLERPLTGYGQEGFNYIFNKYYDPSLFAQEPWFDRAHNAFIDWLTAGGIPAFLLYLALFGTAITLLWKSSGLSRAERILLTAAFAGYACHNLFVFDNLYSYMYFFALLAFIDSQVARPIPQLEQAPEVNAGEAMSSVLPIAAVAGFALVWFVNIPGMQVASKLITALTPSSNGVGANIATFEELAAHPSFAAQEVREQLVSFASAVAKSEVATNEEKQKIVSLAINEMRTQVAAYPKDARERLQLSYLYRLVGENAEALKEVQTALTLSPKKESILIEAGTIEWNKGNMKAVQENFENAYALGPEFPELAIYAAAGNIVVGDLDAADTILLTAFGTTAVDNDILLAAYFGLASAYYAAGDSTNAIITIRKAIALFPKASASGAAAIEQIQAGK